MTVETIALDEKFHRAMVGWQERHFTDYPYLLENWSKFYRQPPFQLLAKLSPLREEKIEVGLHQGQKKFMTTREMDEETRARSLQIIRAQASTELGSIQQHRQSLHKAQDSKLQFDVLRVMAEEYRHGYQMMYLLAADDWGGHVAQETIDELLAMKTGSHVLDAFNVYFDSFVDNIVFAAVIDRVGKYQLQMQQIFAYAPMARSMSPMLSEEAFHLATGVNPLKQWVADAIQDRGNVSLDSIQQHLNKWIPRGMEMFGDERGGKTNVDLGLKTMTNAEAAEKYHREIQEQVIHVLNLAIVKARTQEPADEVVKKLLAGKPHDGLRSEDLLRLPDVRFFRRRGVHAFQMIGTDGTVFTDVEAYLRHLRRALPPAYVSGCDFSVYVSNLRRRLEGVDVWEKELPFFG